MTRALAIAAGAALALLTVAPAAGEGQGRAAPRCKIPAALLTIQPPLARVAARIDRQEALTIVAVGSSSTEGVGASAPAWTYPSRLQTELRQLFPQLKVRVINRGRGGEDAPEEVARIERDVIAERPDLVIWQVGTNAVLRREDPATVRDALRRGIALLRQAGADIILMDMQYAPSVIARPAYSRIQELIAEVADRARVGLYRRFDVMRHQSEQEPDALPAIGPDGLHMTDRSYACIASTLAEAIARNLRTQPLHARSARAEPVAILAGSADLAEGEDP